MIEWNDLYYISSHLLIGHWSDWRVSPNNTRLMKRSNGMQSFQSVIQSLRHSLVFKLLLTMALNSIIDIISDSIRVINLRFETREQRKKNISEVELRCEHRRERRSEREFLQLFLSNEKPFSHSVAICLLWSEMSVNFHSLDTSAIS